MAFVSRDNGKSWSYIDVMADPKDEIIYWGPMGCLTHSFFPRSDRKGCIFCEKGYITVQNINCPQSISVFDTQDNLLAHYPVPEQISGYEYEFQEAVRCIREGKTEADSMPLEETLRVLTVMDQIRAQWGLVYPQEL